MATKLTSINSMLMISRETFMFDVEIFIPMVFSEIVSKTFYEKACVSAGFGLDCDIFPQVVFHCVGGGFGAIVHAQFREDARNIIPHRALAQE